MAVVGVVVAAGLAGGAAYALAQATDGPRTSSAAPSATALPLVTPSPVVSPTPAPTPTASAGPTAVPAGTGTPAATVTASPRASGPVRTYAYPRPSAPYQGLSLSATIDPGNGAVGDVFAVVVKATDGDGRTYFAGLDWGDGTTLAADPSPRRCRAFPPLTSPPGAYRPQADSRSFGPYRHRFDRPGTYTVTVRVSSVNADCRPNGPVAESSSARFEQVQVVVPSSPSPSPAS